MRPAVFVICSGILTFGVPLLIALREIVKTGSGDGASWRPGPRPPAPAPLPTGSGGGVRKLPECLIPKLPPRTAPVIRVLEKV